MPTRFLPDEKGNATLIRELADKLDGFSLHVVERVKPHAPFGTGVHPPRGKKRPPIFFHYRNTIRATTYLGGSVYRGNAIRTPSYNPARWAIASVVYTTATPWGHIYEVTGAKPHIIVIPGFGPVQHPGVAKRPHFVPGLFEAAAEAGSVMRGKVLTERGRG